MLHGRVGFDAVVLGDGSVLAVGDDYACYPGGATAGSERAEVYEPAADRWIAVESLNKPRKTPATVALRDGSAMVIGGINSDDVSFSSTKLFAPTTRTWTDGPLLDVARGQPLAATMADGRVLVTSVVAVEETSSVMTAEIYDPGGGSWSGAATLDGPYLDTLVPLTDGRVLGVGNAFEISLWLEIYDPKRDTWSAIEPAAEAGQQFVALPDGGILAIGGYVEADGGSRPTGAVQRYDPQANRWVEIGSLLTARAAPALAVLPDGRVLVAGGFSGDDFEGSALTAFEVFDPASGRSTALPDLLAPRMEAHLLVLLDGSVLLFGGSNSFNVHGDTPWCPGPIEIRRALLARPVAWRLPATWRRSMCGATDYEASRPVARHLGHEVLDRSARHRPRRRWLQRADVFGVTVRP